MPISLKNKISNGVIAATLLASSGLCLAGDVQVTVLDREGKPVPDAVVVVVTSARGTPKKALPQQVTISQENMRFVPAVSLVGVGAKGRFVNNDAWEHHVRGSAAGAAQFNAATEGGFELRVDAKQEGKLAKSADAVFASAGAVLLGCHLHASMRGHVYVSASPWAALTGIDGTATLEDMPDGAATLKVWHADQLIDITPQQVSVTDAPLKATVQLNVVPRRRRI